MQLAIIEGVLGKDPVYSTTKNGQEFATFSVGVNQIDGGTSWYSVKVWDKMLAITKKIPLQKGNRVIVIGELEVSIFKNAPVKSITATKIDLIYSNRNQSNNQQNDYYQQPTQKQVRQNPNDYVQKQVMDNVQTQQMYNNLVDDDDDLPF